MFLFQPEQLLKDRQEDFNKQLAVLAEPLSALFEPPASEYSGNSLYLLIIPYLIFLGLKIAPSNFITINFQIWLKTAKHWMSMRSSTSMPQS